MKTDFQKKAEELSGATLPMHMPGHKRNVELLGDALPYALDLTEIDGADDLHDPDPDGIIGSLCTRAASLYGAKHAFPLVGGSTCGILAGIRALTHRRDAVIVARNCHKSVWHAVEICELYPTCVLPAIDPDFGICGAITAEDIEAAFERTPSATAVIITSPTYEGVVSDVDAIAAVCKRHSAALFVDAAHGAHFGLSPHFPDFPRAADIAVTSLHKTLPALTGTALGLVFNEKYSSAFARQLGVFETSSPSYILLASIAKCIDLIEKRGGELFDSYDRNLGDLYRSLSPLSHLKLFPSHDRGKIVISTRGTSATGVELARILREKYRIEPEMAHSDYLLLMTSICDTAESLARLCEALLEIDATLTEAKAPPIPSFIDRLPPTVLPLCEAVERDIPDGDAISNAYVWAYPPGIPIVLPGEKLTDEVKTHIEMLKKSGISIKIIKTS